MRISLFFNMSMNIFKTTEPIGSIRPDVIQITQPADQVPLP